jgi:fumarate hydratase subunit beta
MKQIHLSAPLIATDTQNLRAGDRVLLSGEIYTARDAAHKRFCTCLAENTPLPISLTGQILYYVGPTPAKPGQVIGSAGPTTSYRMDPYAPTLIRECGLRGMIGKGSRSPEVIAVMKEYGAVYFAAVGGAAALLSKSITASEIIAYEDLGAEAVRKLTLHAMPLIVAVDSAGNSLYT